MKIVAFLLIFALASCTTLSADSVTHDELLVTSFPYLPADARDVAERLASCAHFFGEMGGDPERDKEIMGFLAELKCGTVDQSVAAMKLKYSRNAAVLDALSQAGDL